MNLLNNQKKEIERIINDLFYDLKAKLLGRFFKGPRIYFEVLNSINPLETLEGVYNYTFNMLYGPGANPSKKRSRVLSEIAGNYLEAERLKTINKVMMGIDKASNFEEVKEEISKYIDKATSHVNTIVNTEIRQVQANAEREGIEKLGASIGVDDPIVCKLGVLDKKLCHSCKSLWHSEDNVKVPKVYKMSELEDGYNSDHKNPKPTIGPTHPHCFDKETQVLTQRGWVDFDEVKSDDLFLSVDLDSGNSDWIEHIGLLKYKYKGKMLSIKNDRVDIMTTPNHKHVIRRRTKKGYKQILTEFEFAKIQSDSISCTIPNWQGNDVNPVFDGKEYNITEFAEFMGYYLSEGCITNGSKNTKRIEICQKKYTNTMEKSFNAIFDRKPYSKNMKIIQYIKKDSELAIFLESFGKSHDKFIPEIIKNASIQTIKVFLDAFRLGDGSERVRVQGFFGQTEEKLYHTSSEKLSADIGELILKIGKKPVYSYQEPKPINHRNGVYTAKKRSITVRENKLPYSSLKNCDIDMVDYNDYVYDVELKKWHTLFVKRNGKVFLSGNCRHVLTMIPPNFGFNSSGVIQFKGFGYDVYKDQRGEE